MHVYMHLFSSQEHQEICSQKMMSEEDDHCNPLTPPITHARSDEEPHGSEFATANAPFSSKEQRSSRCLAYSLATFVTLFISLVIVASVLLSVKSLHVKISSVTMRNVRRANNASFPSLNMTLDTLITIQNPNFGRYEFTNTSARFYYGSADVGSARIGRGDAKARGDTYLSVTANVRANGLPNIRNLSNDKASGLLKLTSHAMLSGKVRFIQIFRKHATADMNCTMILDLETHSLKELHCHRD